jgi:hypothetical protein
MKKILTIIMLCGVMSGYAQKTPPYAASTKTWTFGDQTWSDAIQFPTCNKPNSKMDNFVPYCRSETQGTKTRYYYNWSYVVHVATELCPSSWRVPTVQDFKQLFGKIKSNTVFTAWHDGFFERGDPNKSPAIQMYWTTTPAKINAAYFVVCSDESCEDSPMPKDMYFMLRCVK